MLRRPLIVIRHIPNIDFMGWHKVGFALSLILTLGSIVLFLVQGLNYGIDFAGGTLIEARTLNGPANLATLRPELNGLGLGEVTLQNFGAANEVLIRVPRQPGDDKAQMVGVDKIKAALGTSVDYRRTEVVGPTVGNELIRAGVIATILALLAIAAYVWFRFEWPFGVGAMLSTLHDTLTTIGLFALLQIEFDLTTLAAILTIAGYSINDTVVIYDRVRETMRRYKTIEFKELINKSLNETLSRTILTVGTVALAVLSLLIFGGEVLRGFSIAMLWGVVVGTYSSLFIAAPMLYYIRPKRGSRAKDEEAESEAARPTQRPRSAPRPAPKSGLKPSDSPQRTR
ncbi:MAG TPA: protein translocase subunit SecF [Stellaceae bacterium]|nr:protein translocase subunit SecF [Stellaceae bacterium]